MNISKILLISAFTFIATSIKAENPFDYLEIKLKEGEMMDLSTYYSGDYQWVPIYWDRTMVTLSGPFSAGTTYQLHALHSGTTKMVMGLRSKLQDPNDHTVYRLAIYTVRIARASWW